MIDLTIQSQPDGETCGPTSLHAVYRYFHLNCTLDDVINTVERTTSGGTLAAYLGKDALSRQFTATIYINNLAVFDPTWFKHGNCDAEHLIDKLERQLQVKSNQDIAQSSQAYIQFLKRGGIVKFETVNPRLLKKYFEQGLPILTGLSATYLYKSARYVYVGSDAFHNDIEGTPCGHFVVLCGYDDANRQVIVADPHEENPLSHNNYYKVGINRLINAIMLGVLTYDANLLILKPKEDFDANHSSY